ncbi:15-cis-phytoene desaturase [bacterium HR23]|nr:15-cis-phytoene desaturase [bacterium HR23]
MAGITVACVLADRGWRVTLVERRRWLGGRASSFLDPVVGHHVDLGQHVLMRCFTAYLGLLERLGIRDKVFLQRRLEVPLVEAVTGRRGVLFSQPSLPSPLHLSASFLAYPHLTLREKVRALRGILSVRGADRLRQRDGLEGITFRQWLETHGQTPRIIRHLWEPIILGTLNALPHQVSAMMGIMVLQEALLAGPHTADMGWARTPLSPLLEEAVRRHLARRGGTVLTGVAVARLMWEAERVKGVALADGAEITATAVVSAVPWDALPHLLGPGWAEHPFFAPVRRLKGAPILNIHLWYDRPVMREPFVGFLNSPMQWVFNKSALWSLEGPGQHLSISISGAEAYVGKSQEELEAIFREEMEHLFPLARRARLLHFRGVLMRNATFCPAPGVEALRPPQATPIPNLFLAGEWTRTGWPSTMESAVRSGLLAAEEVQRRFL